MWYLQSLLFSGDREKLRKTLEYFFKYYTGLNWYPLCELTNFEPHYVSNSQRAIARYLKGDIGGDQQFVTFDNVGMTVGIKIPADQQCLSYIVIVISKLSFENSISISISWPCKSNFEIGRLISFMMYNQKLDDYQVYINGDYQKPITLRILNAIVAAELADLNGGMLLDMAMDGEI